MTSQSLGGHAPRHFHWLQGKIICIIYYSTWSAARVLQDLYNSLISVCWASLMVMASVDESSPTLRVSFLICLMNSVIAVNSLSWWCCHRLCHIIFYFYYYHNYVWDVPVCQMDFCNTEAVLAGCCINSVEPGSARWQSITLSTDWSDRWLKCKIRGGGTLHSGLGPDNGRVPFSSIITILGGGTLWVINWRRGNSVPLRPITL